MKNQRGIIVGGAAVGFLILGWALTSVAPNNEIAWVLSVLLLTVFLFSFEIIPIDVAALTIMVMLGLSSILAPLMGLDEGLVEINQLFDGFSSNAVISIIAVMILGAGLDKTGIMNSVARKLIKIGGTTEKRIIPLISGTVGGISGFMQNVGAAALFLPVVGRISTRSQIPMSRLLVPMGFCAILGGTVTMVGSSPLILLNDLIINANENLADDQQINTFDLFDVTPIGIALILSGILYFVVFGRFVLPKGENRPEPTQATATHLKDSYGIDYDIVEVYVPLDSKLIGQELDSFETEHSVRTVALTSGKNILTGKTGVSPGLEIHGADCMALVGRRDALIDFCEEFDLTLKKDLDIFADILSPTSAGLAEVIIAPTSPLIGESARTIALRVNQGVSALSIIRNDESHHEAMTFGVCHSLRGILLLFLRIGTISTGFILTIMSWLRRHIHMKKLDRIRFTTL